MWRKGGSMKLVNCVDIISQFYAMFTILKHSIHTRDTAVNLHEPVISRRCKPHETALARLEMSVDEKNDTPRRK